MLNISNFFQPLNFYILFGTALFLVFLDSLGSFLKKILIKDPRIIYETRLINWLLGFGVFIFIWYVLGFFIYPSRNNLILSIIVLSMISLPFFLNQAKNLFDLKYFKKIILPILIFVPFLPSTFIKASLPPYVWDEMAYHFISPYMLINQVKQYWVFTGGFYENLPRTMDTFYILGFSIFRTYSSVRFIQFFILLTSLIFTYLIISKIWSKFSGLLFLLIFLSLPLKIPYIATMGYVDVPAFSFFLLGLVFILYFFLRNKSPDYLILSTIFWSMAIGTKYTVLIGITSLIVPFIIIYWIRFKDLKIFLNKNLLLRLGSSFVVFGGYWYIKNLIVYGNPIYPFLFRCWGQFASSCQKNSSFFGTWTTPINSHTIYQVLLQLLPQNPLLLGSLIVTTLMVLLFGTLRYRMVYLLISFSFLINLLILKYFSGFDSRYDQYLTFELILLMVSMVPLEFKDNFRKSLKYIILIPLFLSSLFFYAKNLKFINSYSFVDRSEINYALGRENITDWVHHIFPGVGDAVIWCGAPSEKPKPIAQIDPDIIWYGYEGLMRVYLVNCYYIYPSFDPNNLKDFNKIAVNNKYSFWTVSLNECLPDNKVVPKGELNDSAVSSERLISILNMRRLNNKIVCSSEKVLPSLYYLNYKNLPVE